MRELYGDKTIEQWAGHTQEDVEETYDYRAGFIKGWTSAQEEDYKEIARITQLLKEELLSDRDWSKSLKEETWIEYCHANKIKI
jgi:hypothetical protein